jgi:hypothetical protein
MEDTARNRSRDMNSLDLKAPPGGYDYYAREGKYAIAVPTGTRTLLLLFKGRRDRLLADDLMPPYGKFRPRIADGNVTWTTQHTPDESIYAAESDSEMHALDIKTGRNFSWIWPNADRYEDGARLGLMWVAGDQIFLGVVTDDFFDKYHGDVPSLFDVYAAPWPPPRWRPRARPGRADGDITVRFRAPENTKTGPIERFYSIEAKGPRGRGCQRRARRNVTVAVPGPTKAVLRLREGRQWCKGRYRIVIRLRKRDGANDLLNVNRRIERFFHRVRR